MVASGEVLLATERLTLRALTADDVEHLYALDNDPDVMRWINGGAATPRRVIAEQLLPGMMQRDADRPWSGVWACEDKATGAFLGWISLRWSGDGSAVLGYRLARHAWGRGLATEGARALIARGFADPDLARITATTYEKNAASQRVMAKLGMRLVRRFRMTPEEIQASDTALITSDDVWDGDDLLFEVSRDAWARSAREQRHAR